MFETIKPTDEAYTALQSFMAENAGAFDYNALVEHYNEQDQGAIVKFNFKQGKLAQVRRGLEARGLKNNVDFTVSGGVSDPNDANSPFVALVLKSSDAKGTPVVAKPRGKAAQAANAAAGTKAPPAKKAK